MPMPNQQDAAKIAGVYEQLHYYGDSCEPRAGGNDLRALAAETVARLPENVQDWLLQETTHFFIGGSGQDGESFNIHVPVTEVKDGLVKLRVIYLSERLMNSQKDDALWTIAHEIAHSRLDHDTGGYDVEVEVDNLVQEWGFIEPKDRGVNREAYR